MISRLIQSIVVRYRRFNLGLYHPLKEIQSSDPWIAGARIPLSIPIGEKPVHDHEFWKIMIGDCYRIRRLSGRVTSVLDIGANIGFFSQAARHCFKGATIHCYEPNGSIQEHLMANVRGLNVDVYAEAVGSTSGHVSLLQRENSLHSKTIVDAAGSTPLVSIQDAVSRIGGQVDLLKLDCEGAEWDILDSQLDWGRIKFITMEYHLWAKAGSTEECLKNKLARIGFRIAGIEPSPHGHFGLLWADAE